MDVYFWKVFWNIIEMEVLLFLVNMVLVIVRVSCLFSLLFEVFEMLLIVDFIFMVIILFLLVYIGFGFVLVRFIFYDLCEG